MIVQYVLSIQHNIDTSVGKMTKSTTHHKNINYKYTTRSIDFKVKSHNNKVFYGFVDCILGLSLTEFHSWHHFILGYPI